ncbi:hypothetical protein WN944_023143 [Citrus x changshan-huyou]|uniref:Uncharacterized protein n=1 Tax=Citrus x changshan-huyou TaxID=2935761 RepID=A0AAP0R3M0_9ROSI
MEQFYKLMPMDRRDLWSSASTASSGPSISQTTASVPKFLTKLFEASNNKLAGESPAEIGNLLKFQLLNIAENHLRGQLPASIGNLSALQEINVNGNRLGGRIPSTRSHVRNLISFNVGLNQFSGMFPPINNISSLEYIFIHRNIYHGSLPLDIGVNLPNLRFFIISGNNLTGSLQDSLSNATNLQKLDINRNLFSGKVSINFGGLQNLSWLNLGKNNLGTRTANDLDFITLLTNCTKLEVLVLDSNRFGAVLPFSLANLSTTMTGIAFGNNQISGFIPDGIANLVNLNALGVEFNQLAVTILKSLQMLFLHENVLQGTIPSFLGNLTMLTQRLLEVNDLLGNIPPSIGNCKNLILLTTRKNKPSGTMPRQLPRIITLSVLLNLSDNLLSGHFPAEVGKLKNLVSLDISSNMFSGEIPTTLGCTSLEYLCMQDNSFTGSIPSTLSSLKSITELDLSRNNLSGHIPQYLENLSFLSFLNLSYNHFESKGILRFRVRKKYGTITVSVITSTPRVNGRIEEQSQGTGKSLAQVLTLSAKTVLR